MNYIFIHATRPYESGKIKQVNFIGFDEELIFIQEFDEDGNETFRRGVPIYLFYNKDTVTKGSSLEIVSYMTTHGNSELYLYTNDHLNGLVEQDVLDDYFAKTSFYSLKDSILGEHDIIFTSINVINKDTLRDTLNFKYTVIN